MLKYVTDLLHIPRYIMKQTSIKYKLNNSELVKSLKKNYYDDLYIENYTYPINIYFTAEIIKNTIDVYIDNHPNFNYNTVKQIPEHCFQHIVKHDKVISINENIIYKELYKILYLIHNTFNSLDFIKNKRYPKKHFAYIQSDKKRLKGAIRSHKNMVVNNSSLSEKGELRVNWYFYSLFKKNKDLTRLFLNMITIADITKSSFFHKESSDTLAKVLHFFNDKLIQQTTPKTVIKSLGILLHYEFKNYLKIKDTKSKELISELISYIFNTDSPNDEEFNNYIYISSTLSFIPIFGATDINLYPTHKREEIKRTFKKFLKEINYKNNVSNFQLSLMIKEALEQSHMTYLQKYPMELLRINPKYSTLK